MTESTNIDGVGGDEARSEYLIGIDDEGRRYFSNSEMSQWSTYTLVYLTTKEVDAIMNIPYGDLPAIQSLLSKYY